MKPLKYHLRFLNGRLGRYLFVSLAAFLTIYLYSGSRTRPLSKAIVVASLTDDDTGWIHEYFPDWQAYIYVANDPTARLTVEKNIGRESTVYLTYIIDHYDNLPDVSVYVHGKRYQWHNEDPMYDGVPVLKNLRLSHVLEEGYANLRCTWVLGCPHELIPQWQPTKDPESDRDRTEIAYASAFKELFPGQEVPAEVGLPCGSQMALSKAKIRERPKSDYIRYRQWLWDTELHDSISGRVLEYSWHIIMGKPAVHCPDAKTCFCEKLGLCDLECKEEGICEGRYILPRYSIIPVYWPEEGPGMDGWPERDWWNKEDRPEGVWWKKKDKQE